MMFLKMKENTYICVKAKKLPVELLDIEQKLYTDIHGCEYVLLQIHKKGKI